MIWNKHRKRCCIYTIFNPLCNMTQKGRRTRRTYFERHHQLHCHELAKLVEMSTNSKKLMSISTTKWSGRWSLKKFIWLVGGAGEWHSELRFEKLVQKMNVWKSHQAVTFVVKMYSCKRNVQPTVHPFKKTYFSYANFWVI